MPHQTNYLQIHETAYARLRREGKSSWSEATDLAERVDFYREALLTNGANPGAPVLILGCGDGETALALAQGGYQVTGVDISPSAIQWAKEKARARNLRCTFNTANLVSEWSSPEAFSAVIDDHCLHCIIGGDRQALLLKVHSLLGDAGIFISRTHCGEPPASAGPDFFAMWDPQSRCQAKGGIAGRYFGWPEKILEEFFRAGLDATQTRVFTYPNGWNMLEAICVRRP